MAQLGHQQTGLEIGDVADAREVGTGGEDELLAGDRDAVDFARGGARGQLVEALAQLDEGLRPEGVRARVVAIVVERDEGERLAARERDVAHVRVRDDLVGVESQQLREVGRLGCHRRLGHPSYFFPV